MREEDMGDARLPSASAVDAPSSATPDWEVVKEVSILVRMLGFRESVWGDYGTAFLENVCRRLNRTMLRASCMTYQSGPTLVLFGGYLERGDMDQYRARKAVVASSSPPQRIERPSEDQARRPAESNLGDPR